MRKQEFLSELESRLKGLPKDDIKERIAFYDEMIDDRMEEGKSESEALKEIGTVDEVVAQIAKETPLVKLVKERVKPKKRISTFNIILLILGFPLWFPLLITFGVLLLVGYILLWTMVIVTYAIEISFIGSAIMGIFTFFVSGFNIAYLAIALVSFGLAIFMFYVCIAATKVNVKLTKRIALSIKKRFVSRR